MHQPLGSTPQNGKGIRGKKRKCPLVVSDGALMVPKLTLYLTSVNIVTIVIL